MGIVMGGVAVGRHRPNGKCIRGKNGDMLVRFGDEKMVVLGRRLRRRVGIERAFASGSPPALH